MQNQSAGPQARHGKKKADATERGGRIFSNQDQPAA
jgi:hypothetical protein